MDKGYQINEINQKMFIDKNGNTVLHKAVKENNLSLLYKSSLSESVINQQNRDGYSALHYAVKHGNKQIVEAVLQCGVDPFLKTKLSQTACDIASINKRPDLVDLINSYSPGLYRSILAGDKNKTIDLLKKWVNPTNVAKATNLTFRSETFNTNLNSMQIDYYIKQNHFIHLVSADDFDRVSIFAVNQNEIGSFINTCHTINGTTPLAIAIRNHNIKMVELLLKLGADLRIRLQNGTPLIHYSWNANAPFIILISIFNSNEFTWHMRSPENGSTILFELANSSNITSTHIYKILSITQCSVLQDRDYNNLDFFEFCQKNNRQDLIETMWESVAEMIGSKVGKMKLTNIVTSLMSDTVLSVPDYIFKRIYTGNQCETIFRDYQHFMENAFKLENAGKMLFQSVMDNDLSGVKLHNIANFVNKNGRNALHEAILLDRFEIAQWLVAERPSLLFIADAKDMYPIHYSYGVSDAYGKKYIHLLVNVTPDIDQQWLTDMYNNLPNSVKMSLEEELKIPPEN